MAKTQYKVMKAGKSKAPPISLIRISGTRKLISSLEAFGPNCFNENVAEIQKQYSHPQTGEVITLREPTTAESILAVSYDFAKRAEPKILDPRWLQMGRIVRTPEGVFANIPKDAQGKPITDKQTLKSFLDNCEKVNGIWLYNGNDKTLRDFGYAPYETFEQGVQNAVDFAESGLARVLEHTAKTAVNLKEIASKENYSRGVNVSGFDKVNEPALRVVSLSSVLKEALLFALEEVNEPALRVVSLSSVLKEALLFALEEVNEPALRVVSLSSDRDLYDKQLVVSGYSRVDYYVGYSDGYAFGVLDSVRDTC
jgi:hypothetical protein